MVTYINKEIKNNFIELKTLLDSKSNWVSDNLDDYNKGAYLLLNSKQLSFKKDNPTASVEEVFNMKLTPVQERTVGQAINEKLETIKRHDSSELVNSFIVNGVTSWLTPDVRANYKNSIEAAELLGETHITFMIAGIVATSTLQDARIMLAKIQRYADRCTIVTETHKATVSKLITGTVEEIDAYDYTTGYPEKEEFTINVVI